MRKSVNALKGVCAVAAILLVLASCSANRDFVAASRAFVDAVGPEYLSYVRSDPSLDESAKDLRENTVRMYDAAVKAAEEGR